MEDNIKLKSQFITGVTVNKTCCKFNIQCDTNLAGNQTPRFAIAEVTRRCAVYKRSGMSPVRIKLSAPTLGITSDNDGKTFPFRLPKGAIVWAPGEYLITRGFVDVEYQGRRLSVFAIDLRDRGTLVGVAGANS